MPNMILRQYRRWLLGGLLFFVWFQMTIMLGVNMNGDVTDHSARVGQAFWYDGGYAFAVTWRMVVAALLVSLVLTVGFAAFFPAFLIVVEVFPLVFGVGAVADALTPEHSPLRLIEHVLAISTMIGLMLFYSGSGRFGKLGAKDLRCTMTFETSASLETVFRSLVPTIDEIEDYHVAGSRVFQHETPGSESFYLATRPRYGHGFFIEEVNLEEVNAPSFARYLTNPLNDGKSFRFPPEGRRIVTITPTATGTDVKVDAEFRQVPLAIRLHWFLISMTKDTAACWKARIERRKDWSVVGRTTLGPGPTLPKG
jgi:hypothetical protein